MFFSFLISPYALIAIPFLYFLLPFVRNRNLYSIPGPSFAKFTNLWYMYQCRQGSRYLAVDEAHKKFGTLVRIQPNHVSIADPEAIPVVYGHGNGFLKSEYYDAFVSIQRGLFNTRDRAEHTRKRKTISHTFSAKSVGQFEKYIRGNLQDLTEQWNRISDTAEDSGQKWAEIDSLHWFNYLAFDIIGDLAFGAPFGMLSKGADIAEVRLTPDSPITYAPAVEVLNRRGEVSNTLGILPWLKPYAGYLPDRFFRDGLEAVGKLAGIAVARVDARLDDEEAAKKSDRVDLLARLMEGRDGNGEKLGREELTAEALTNLIAGSDTTSNTTCALLYWCLRTEGVVATLAEELDKVVPEGVVIPEYAAVKDLP
ncbi:hypothetical protein MMC25_007167 [Agyrium rufum]|nr:hypothetical protein [Agyrium rufum]